MCLHRFPWMRLRGYGAFFALCTIACGSLQYRQREQRLIDELSATPPTASSRYEVAVYVRLAAEAEAQAHYDEALQLLREAERALERSGSPPRCGARESLSERAYLRSAALAREYHRADVEHYRLWLADIHHRAAELACAEQ